MKVKKSNCDETQNSNCDKTQLKLWWNSKTQIVIKLKNSNCDETKKLKWWQTLKTKNGDKTKKNSYCEKNPKTQIVTKLILTQVVTKFKWWKNFIYDITQIVIKLKICNSNCDQTKNSNCEKTQKLNLWKKNYKTQIMTKLKLWQISIFNKKYFKKSLLVRTFWHLDNPWYVLWAAFRDSCNVFEDKLQFNVNELKEMFQICKSIVIWILCVMVRHHCISP